MTNVAKPKSETLSIAVVDDEPLARARMLALLRDMEGEGIALELVGEAENGEQALKLVQQRAIDVMFIDIRMPVMDGIECARHLLNVENAPRVVFCTAYEEHAIAAFELRAVDYLLKPVRRERLLESLKRVKAEPRRTSDADLKTAAVSRRTHLSARVRGELRLIAIDEVIYLQADTKYVEVHSSKERVLIEESLVHLEEEFAEVFVRIHRNCLVARKHISGLSRSILGEVSVILKDRSERLEVSRRNAASVRKFLKEL
jgi:two-component system, LytTR family, response regulator AlgR